MVDGKPNDLVWDYIYLSYQTYNLLTLHFIWINTYTAGFQVVRCGAISILSFINLLPYIIKYIYKYSWNFKQFYTFNIYMLFNRKYFDYFYLSDFSKIRVTHALY
jgi:hypothetical protein